jgi:uncharacterized membrane protein
MDRSRLEAFSDGVFAVAITLLVLNLVTPVPSHNPNHTLLKQLGNLWPSLLAYLLSFLMIGIIWVNHHVLVRSIKTVDRTLLFLNLLLLMFVVLIPFGTSTMAAYRLADSPDGRTAVVVYAGAFFGMSMGFASIFEWTLHGRERMLRRLPREQHWPARIKFVSGGLVYLVSMGVAAVNSIAGFVIIALVAVYYIVERTPSPDGSDLDSDPEPG